MKLLTQIEFESRFEEVEKLEDVLNNLQSQLGFDDELYAKLMLVVSEAVTNGIVHGNKLNEDKKVDLKVYHNEATSQLIFESEDEGEGFKPDLVPDPLAEENLLKASGRGIYLMREYAEEVSYSNNGRKLKVVFNL